MRNVSPVIALVIVAAAACGAAHPSATTPTPTPSPPPTSAPPATAAAAGWSCFAYTAAASAPVTSCERTALACERSVATYRQGADVTDTFSACEPSPVAYCFGYVATDR